MTGLQQPVAARATPRGSRVLALCVGLLVALAAASSVRHLWNTDGLVYEFDQTHIQFARFAIMHDAVAEHGAFPHWQHMLYAGAPFHANPESACLYPLTLPIAGWFEPIAAMNVFTVLHTALAALGMFLLVRDLARRRAGVEGALVAPALAGLAFAVNMYFRRESINLVTYGAAHALLPWTLLTIDRVLTSARPLRASGIAAVVVAAFVLTGGTYVIVFGALFLVSWALWRAIAGSPSERRHAYVYLPLVAGLAFVLALGKFLPMFEWLPMTNRTGVIPIESMSRRALAGANGDWGRYGTEALARLGGPLGVVLLALAAVCGRRIAPARFAFAWLLVVLVLSFGQPYAWLWHLGPPFDRIRTGAERVWLIANLVWPLALGLGLCALERGAVRRWLARRQRNARLAVGAFALGATLLAAPLALHRPTAALADHLASTEPRDEVLERYTTWRELADTVGRTNRVWWVGKRAERTLGGRNEQLPVAAFDLETPAGFLGYIWPQNLADHLYLDADGATLPEEARLKRAGVLAVSHVVPSRPHLARRLLDDGFRFEPAGVEVGVSEANPWFRPRVFAPSFVVAVIAPRGARPFVRALRDRDDLAADVVYVEFSQASDLRAVGAEQVDAVIALDAPADGLDAFASDGDVDAAANFVRSRLPAAGVRGIEAGRLLRAGPNASVVQLDPAEKARWIVLAERWADAPGWRLASAGTELVPRPADGVATAVLVPAGGRAIAAHYVPPGFRLGLGLSGMGLLIAFALIVWPAARSSRPDGRG